MKTLDEVINKLECYPVSPSTLPCSVSIVTVEDLNDVLSYLKEYRTLQIGYIKAMADLEDNPPLTWDELKTMEGKPVWVEVLDYNGKVNKWRGQWMIVRDFTQGWFGQYCHMEPNHRTWPRYSYGDLWQVYRKERE